MIPIEDSIGKSTTIDAVQKCLQKTVNENKLKQFIQPIKYEDNKNFDIGAYDESNPNDGTTIEHTSIKTDQNDSLSSANHENSINVNMDNNHKNDHSREHKFQKNTSSFNQDNNSQYSGPASILKTTNCNNTLYKTTREISPEANGARTASTASNKISTMQQISKEDRIRMVREKRDAEIEKRKQEIEENLRRKSELRDRQLKERQKRIDELKHRENERRARVEERRRQRDELIKIKLNELVKREQERMIIFRSHQNRNVPISQIKFDRLNNQNHHSNELNKTSVLVSSSVSSHLNKSQSAFNLTTCKKRDHIVASSNSSYDQPIQNCISQHNFTNVVNNLSSNNKQVQSDKKLHSATQHLTSSKKIESQKINNEPSLSSSLGSSTREACTQKRKKNSSLVTTLSTDLQTFVNRLSIPKKKDSQVLSSGQETLSSSLNVQSAQQRNSYISKPTPGDIINNEIQLNDPNQAISSGISSEASSSISIAKKANQNLKSISQKGSNQKQTLKSFPKKIHTTFIKTIPSNQDSSKVRNDSQNNSTKKIPQSQSMNTIEKSINMTKKEQKQQILSNTKSASNLTNMDPSLLKSSPLSISCTNETEKKSQNENESDIKKSISPQIVVEKSLSEENTEINLATTNSGTTIVATKSYNNEEEVYKKRLEEKRRQAREKAALEEEAERIEIERQRHEEEEAEKRAAEEEERLNKLAREIEERRMQEAIAQNKRLEEERQMREDTERRMKEEVEKKAREESERIERERLEKLRKDEEERLERKKKIDAIMRRVHRDESVPSSLNTSSSNLNLLISTSNVDLSASTTLINSGNTQNDSVSNDARSKLMISSMINTTSSIENSAPNSTSTLKTPVLQSILSKTRLNSILNKYDAGQSLAAAAAAISNNSSSAEVQPSSNQQSLSLSPELKSELDEVRIEVEDDCTKQITQIISQSSVSSSTSSSAAASPQIKNTEVATQDSSKQSSPANTNLLLL